MSSTIVPGKRKKERCARSAKKGRTGDGTDGKRRLTINARRNGEPDGQTGASGEKRATKRESGTGGAETSGGWRATKRENGTSGAETSGVWRATKRENGTEEKATSSGQRATGREAWIARERDGKPKVRRREDQC